VDWEDEMKLAILGSRGIPAQYGGFETFAEELSVRLVKQGVEVTVYCEAGEGELPDMYKGVHLVHIPAPSLGPLTTILFDLLCLWHARSMFDVVYMLGYGTSIFCFIPRLWGSTVWINMDGVEWARSKWNSLAKLWFKIMEAAAMWTPSRIIADAQGILDHLQSRHSHIPPASVIPYGAPLVSVAPDTCQLDEWQLTSNHYYLVVCRLESENSVKEIINGYLHSGSKFPLVVVGGIDRATNYVKELLLMADGNIRFIGAVYNKTKLQALRYHALAYFHGHTVGGTNPSLLEALGCGNIVIAHDNTFNREVAGTAAFYFSLKQNLAGIIRDVESLTPEQMMWMKAAARERIRTTYNWELITDSYFKTLPQKQSETEKIVRWPLQDLNSRLLELLMHNSRETEQSGQKITMQSRTGVVSSRRMPQLRYRKVMHGTLSGGHTSHV
jgi:glycosyltransferase involved in cell wall biosynthesis